MNTLVVQIRPNRCLWICARSIEILAILSLLSLSISWSWRYAIVISFLVSIGLHRLKPSQLLTQVGYNSYGTWCQTRDQLHWVKVLPDSRISRWCLSLHLYAEDAKKHFNILMPVWQYSALEYRSLARYILTNTLHT